MDFKGCNCIHDGTGDCEPVTLDDGACLNRLPIRPGNVESFIVFHDRYVSNRRSEKIKIFLFLMGLVVLLIALFFVGLNGLEPIKP